MSHVTYYRDHPRHYFCYYRRKCILSNPTDLIRVNIAQGVTNLLWIALGLFLIGIYVKSKQSEDAGIIQNQVAPDSPEDITRLKKYRNWIFGFVIIFEILGSVGSWIVNDYTAGFSLINTEIIFDVLVNIVLAYILVELFRNKKGVLTLLLVTALTMGVVEGAIDLMRHEWYSAASCFLGLSLYFGVAILARSPVKIIA